MLRLLRPRLRPRQFACRLSTGTRTDPSVGTADPEPSEPEAPPKTYAAILEEMGARKRLAKSRYTIPPPRVVDGHYDVVSATDLRRPITRGDLLLLASGPVMVVDRSSRQDERLTVADAVGETREINLGAVEARLGSLVLSTFANSRPLYDPAGGRVVPEVHNLLAVELRNFYNRAARMSSQLQSTVGDVLRLLQREHEPRTMAFFDFAALVDNIDLAAAGELEYPRDYLELAATSRLTPELIYAVRMALDHYTLANKHVLEFSYLGAYCLTVLPRAIEARNLQILTAPVVAPPTGLQFPRSQLEYTKDYALGNLSPSNPSSDGLALEIVRRHPHFAQPTLSRDSAAELVDRYGMLNPQGPYLDRYAYHWMADPPASLPPPQRDLFGHVREPFDLPVYCIDSATPHEIDDGISVEVKGDTAVVGVHIADPTSAYGADLVSHVYRRPSTVYLPTGPLFMLNETVSGAFSLRPGAARRALSVFTTYDLATGQRLRTEMRHSLLSNIVTKTYVDVDAELGGAPPRDLAVLAGLAAQLAGQRAAAGAFAFRYSGGAVATVESGAVTLTPPVSAGDSPATLLVTEMMVQANSAVAEYTAERGIPNIYRSQTLEFWAVEERQRFAAVVAAGEPIGFQFRANIPRARLSTGVSAHAALGLAAYSHFTSPLRRGQDILTHLSLASHLAGAPAPFSHAKLGGMLPWIETAQLQVKQIQKTAQRFWTLTALASRVGETLRGTVCDVRDDYVEVYLPDYGVRARATFKAEIDTDVTVTLVESSAVGNRCVVCI